MNRCNRCKIDIIDDTVICPLCHSVVKREMDANSEVPDYEEEFDKYPSRSVMYPDITRKMRKMRFVVKLVVFLSVLVEIVLVMLNRYIGKNVRWSAICGVGLAYICFTLIYSFMYQRGHRRKIMYQAIGIMVLCVAIDCLLGYQGWSLEYAIPSTIIAIDLAVFIIMIFNLNNFQVYIMMQLYTVALSTVMLIVIWASKLAKFVLLANIAEAISVFLLAGMLVFGDKKAIAELSRRFRI